jgi:solute carrier family 25 (mitochondrial uncoupling protein), member 8/9
LYNGSIDCYKKMYAEGGIANFWTGWGPNVARNSIINAAELASYDQYKEMFLKYGILNDGTPCHLVCGSLAGLNAVIVGSPVDVMKTKMMNAPIGTFKGPVDCFMQTWKSGGVGAFYAGFGPNFGRLASFNCVCFLAFERVKKFFE